MGTDIKIVPEVYEDYWIEVCHPEVYEAIEKLESRNYFMYALWADVRNNFILKDDLIERYAPIERSFEDKKYWEEYWGLDQPSFTYDDAQLYHSKYEVSYSSAKAITNSDYYGINVIELSTLLNFDYNASVEFETNVSGEEYTYIESLGPYYLQALSTLQKHGVTRLVICFG